MPKDLFAEFDHTARPRIWPSGDVKYHQGFSSTCPPPAGPHLSLAFNPSHLEIVNPVVEGLGARAYGPPRATQGKQVLPGAGAWRRCVAGQGVVMETLALAETRLQHRRHGAHRYQQQRVGFTQTSRQPLHVALLHVVQNDRGARAACQWRRPRSEAWCWPHWR